MRQQISYLWNNICFFLSFSGRHHHHHPKNNNNTSQYGKIRFMDKNVMNIWIWLVFISKMHTCFWRILLVPYLKVSKAKKMVGINSLALFLSFFLPIAHILSHFSARTKTLFGKGVACQSRDWYQCYAVFFSSLHYSGGWFSRAVAGRIMHRLGHNSMPQ